MTPDRLAQLVLERRFGALTPPESADLSAALSSPDHSAEAARLEALLDHAPASATAAKADFKEALAARIDAAAEDERRFTWGSAKSRALAAYAGIAAGALIYAGLNGWFDDAARESVDASAYSASLDLQRGLPR